MRNVTTDPGSNTSNVFFRLLCGKCAAVLSRSRPAAWLASAALVSCGLSLSAVQVELSDFSLGGYGTWYEQYDMTYDGGTAWRSGSIGNSQYSSMSAEVYCVAEGSISFYWKVSSESGYDYLECSVDNLS